MDTNTTTAEIMVRVRNGAERTDKVIPVTVTVTTLRRLPRVSVNGIEIGRPMLHEVYNEITQMIHDAGFRVDRRLVVHVEGASGYVLNTGNLARQAGDALIALLQANKAPRFD